MPFQEEFLHVRGVKIHMLKGGSGDPLLYLHSAGGEVVWLPFFEQLAQRYTVYLPAHPGFGKSEGLDRIDAMEDLVFHYTDLMDQLGLVQPYVAGLSLGGWLAAELATRYAHRIRKLALMNAVGLRVPGSPIADLFRATPEELRKMVFHDPQSDLAKAFVPDVPSPEVMEETMKAREATARVGWNPYLCNLKLRGRLYRITVPTLILWGESDRLVPLAHGEAYRDGIAGSRLVVLKQCGHAPPFEKPEETVAALREFFRA
ncbi:MAG: alpha/beta hydrolase [Deltaproteobacteria bacterium]|nr:alpha/beta hydrolase [Deltaproteobacteria bacterium]